MKITSRQLRRIIQEEVARMMNEEDAAETVFTTGPSGVQMQGAPDTSKSALGARFEQFRAAAQKVGDRVGEQFKMGIDVGQGVPSPFSTPNGKGQLIVALAPAGTAGNTTGRTAVTSIDVQAEGLGKIQLSDMGLMRGVGARVARAADRLDPNIPAGARFTVRIPISWSPGKVILGSPDTFSNYTADVVPGGAVSIVGVGTRGMSTR
jgi:hypothetical protein